MSVRRVGDFVLLEDICNIEDAEDLLRLAQADVAGFDWSGCAHLHTACLQVILVAGLPMRGTPTNPDLLRWIGPLLPRDNATAIPSARVLASEICS